jgi:hypothetical protein
MLDNSSEHRCVELMYLLTSIVTQRMLEEDARLRADVIVSMRNSSRIPERVGHYGRRLVEEAVVRSCEGMCARSETVLSCGMQL